MIKAYVNKDSVKVIDIDIEGKNNEVMLELSLLVYKVLEKIEFNTELDYEDLIITLEYILIQQKEKIKGYIEKGEAFENGTK